MKFRLFRVKYELYIKSLRNCQDEYAENKTALQVKSREFAIIETYAEATINKSSNEAKKRSIRKTIVFRQSESRNVFMKKQSWCEQ